MELFYLLFFSFKLRASWEFIILFKKMGPISAWLTLHLPGVNNETSYNTLKVTSLITERVNRTPLCIISRDEIVDVKGPGMLRNNCELLVTISTVTELNSNWKQRCQLDCIYNLITYTNLPQYPSYTFRVVKPTSIPLINRNRIGKENLYV